VAVKAVAGITTAGELTSQLEQDKVRVMSEEDRRERVKVTVTDPRRKVVGADARAIFGKARYVKGAETYSSLEGVGLTEISSWPGTVGVTITWAVTVLMNTTLEGEKEAPRVLLRAKERPEEGKDDRVIVRVALLPT